MTKREFIKLLNSYPDFEVKVLHHTDSVFTGRDPKVLIVNNQLQIF